MPKKIEIVPQPKVSRVDVARLIAAVDLLLDASDKLSHVAPGQLSGEREAAAQYERAFDELRAVRGKS